MQISTRTEDFVVDTLKLRIHIGPYLREVFKDPTKRKVDLLHACFFWYCFRFTSLCYNICY
jgi:ribonuclease D